MADCGLSRCRLGRHCIRFVPTCEPWYTAYMAPLLEKQLEPVTSGREKMTRVRVGKDAVVVLSQQFFDQVQHILNYVASQPDASPPNGANEWNEAKNARRVDLINKKYAKGLTGTENKELKRLQTEVDEFVNRAVPVRNEVLELLLLGLKQAAKARKR